MVDRKKVKTTGFIIPFLILLGISFGVLNKDRETCMGVTLVAEEKLMGYTKDLEIDIAKMKFNGENVAVDLSSDTIYISQSKARISHFSLLQGVLSFRDPNCTIYLVKNKNIYNLQETIKNGMPLSLAIVSDKERKVKYIKVILTTLPVIRMEGEEGELDEEKRQLYSGTITI